MPKFTARLARLSASFVAWLDRTFMPPAPLTTETPAPAWLVALAFVVVPLAYGVGALVVGGMFAGAHLEATGRAVTTPPGTLETRATYLQIANFYTTAEARATGARPGWRAGDIAEDEARIAADTWHAMADEIGEDIGDL